MKSKYFRYGTAFGLLCATLMAYGMIGKTLFDDMLLIHLEQRYFGGLSFIIGVAAAFSLAFYFDRKNISKNFLIRALLLPALIFTVGIIAGSVANGLISGRKFEFFDYGFKPLYWLSLYGLPASLLVGIAYYFLVMKFSKANH